MKIEIQKPKKQATLEGLKFKIDQPLSKHLDDYPFILNKASVQI